MNRQQIRAARRREAEVKNSEGRFVASASFDMRMQVKARSWGEARQKIMSLSHGEWPRGDVSIMNFETTGEILDGPYGAEEYERYCHMITAECDRPLNIGFEGEREAPNVLASEAYNAILRACDMIDRPEISGLLEAVKAVSSRRPFPGADKFQALIEASIKLRDAQWAFYAAGRVDGSDDLLWAELEYEMQGRR